MRERERDHIFLCRSTISYCMKLVYFLLHETINHNLLLKLMLNVVQHEKRDGVATFGAPLTVPTGKEARSASHPVR